MDQTFWRYEYLKHGSYNNLYQQKYLDTEIFLQNCFNLLNSLALHTIILGNQYNPNTFSNVVKSITNTYPKLICKTVRGPNILTEVRIYTTS